MVETSGNNADAGRLLNGKSVVLPALIIALLSIIAFSGTFKAAFVYDDIPGIVENEFIRSFHFWPGYFTKGLWDNTAVKLKDDFLYRPFPLMLGSTIYIIFGASPTAYHFFSVLLHAADSVLAFLLFRKLLNSETGFGPFAGGLAFASHPIHTEAVGWIGASVDLCLTLFCLISFLSYIRYREDGGRVFFISAAVAYGFALLTKETATTLIGLIILFDILVRKKPAWKEYCVFIGLVAAYMTVRSAVLGKSLGTLQFSASGIGSALLLVSLYMKSFLLPWPMGYKFTMPALGLSGGTAAFFFIVFISSALAFSRKLLFPILWIFITLSPPLMLAFYSKPIFAERFLYISSIGFCAVLGAFYDHMISARRRFALLSLGLVVVVWTASAAVSAGFWSNEETLYFQAIRNSPHSFVGYANLTRYYEKVGDTTKAIDTFLRAIENVPDSDKITAYDNVAYLYGLRGDSEKSILYYTKELELSPDSTRAFLGLGNNYTALKDYPKALSFYELALSTDRNNAEIYYNMALIYELTGDVKAASKYYGLFLSSGPSDKFKEAVLHARRFLSLQGMTSPMK